MRFAHRLCLIFVSLLPLVTACDGESTRHHDLRDAALDLEQGLEDQLLIDALVDSELIPEPDANMTPCTPVVPVEATRRPGDQDDGSQLTVTGRKMGQYGVSRRIEGFPSNILVHPNLPVLYLTSTSHDDRDLHVLNRTTLEVIQSIAPNDLYAGMQLDLENGRLMVAGGDNSSLLVFTIEPDGTLSNQTELALEGYVATSL